MGRQRFNIVDRAKRYLRLEHDKKKIPFSKRSIVSNEF